MLRIKAIIFSLFISALISVNLSAQIYDPVNWTVGIEDKGDGNAELVIKATIEKKWHLYAQQISDDPDAMGPVPTSFVFDAGQNYELVGNTTEGKPIVKFDPMFELDLRYFENSAEFRQKIKILNSGGFNAKVTVSYMACDDSKCTIPVDEEYTVAVNGGGAAGTEGSGASEGIFTPVKWEARSESLGNGEYLVILKAKMEEGWHVYSQVLTSEDGPLPTVFSFSPADGVEFIGGVEEPEPIRKYDPNFMMDLDFHEGITEFKQKLRFTGDKSPVIACSVDFMTCNDERCLPPELVEFEVDLSTGLGKIKGADAGAVILDPSQIVPDLKNLNLDAPLGQCGETEAITNIWLVFVFGFIGGLIALLTPCVFPMIPLTVSFFTKSSAKKNGLSQALLYGFFIFLIYALLSLPFHFGTDPEKLNEIATSITLNVVFFVVFVVFAISFFGYFEITLPNSFVNKVDNASNVGGILGIFFMALTLALVSFSCTGPILGTVLGNSLKEGPWPVTAAMSGFGVALGLPFAVFAAFPKWLNNLPKSGGWLNSVKVVLGFIELALALKFLSNADLVMQWHLIERETFFLIWTLLGAATFAYLMGWIRFPHDSPIKKLSTPRMIFAGIFLAFTVYIAPGMLKERPWSHDLLSGFPPPFCTAHDSYSWYADICESTYHPEFDDFYAAQQKATELGKPILIDFTGWACVNCRKMEETVWTEPQIREILENEFVVVSLYVDDKVELPADQQGVFRFENGTETIEKKIRTIGNKWATFQTHAFRNNSQPYYVMLSPDGTLLGNPVGYTPEASEYQEYLECGISTYRGIQQSASIK
jgi:thiol:disulfide interchange protein DsbD